MSQWGAIDILVNNAGTNPVMGPLMDMDPAAWDKIMDVNLKGPYLASVRVARAMVERGEGGKIINISSGASLDPAPMLGAYSISKAALNHLTRVLAKECGVLRAVAAQVGDNQVRHRGTIGGSVAHGDPASDLPAALLALDATFVVQGPGGARSVAANDFFEGFLETALAPDELLTEIQVRKSGASGFAYEKFNRRAQDWAIVGAVAARVNGGTHVALVNMGATPLRARAVETALTQGASAADAAREAAVGTEPPADLNASPEYRTHLAQVLVRRALEAI